VFPYDARARAFLSDDLLVSGQDVGVEVIRALAQVRTLLDFAGSAREGPGLNVSRSVTASEFEDGVLTIDVFLTVIDELGIETEWFAELRNTPTVAGWAVSRHVAVQTSVGGEVKNLGRADLRDVAVADSWSLAEEVPALVDELLALGVPQAR
jgi:hypothetical protein